MPAKVSKVRGGFQVRTPKEVHAKATTQEKAAAQARLLNAIEHGFVPTQKKARKRA